MFFFKDNFKQHFFWSKVGLFSGVFFGITPFLLTEFMLPNISVLFYTGALK